MNKTQIFINAIAQCDQFVMFIEKLLKEESIEGNKALISLRDHIQSAKKEIAEDLLDAVRYEG